MIKRTLFPLVCLLFLTMISCQRETEQTEQTTQTEQTEKKAYDGTVEVTASYDSENDMHLFDVKADSIPSGWTTFRFTNASPIVHFMLLEQMPEGKTMNDIKSEILPLFQEAMDIINAGNTEEGLAKLGELPEWYTNITFMGGPGLTIPGKITETTVNLKPGYYIMECYVKNENGTFHSAMGMLSDLYVTEETSNVEEPTDVTIDINLSNAGIDVRDDISAGSHLMAVNFNEPEPPLLGNDIHLIRLRDDQSIESVTQWMDWSQPNGLVSTPENLGPAEFLGGTHEMPMGNTAYFKADLEPGRYAFVSERPANNPLYKEFTVSSDDLTSN